MKNIFIIKQVNLKYTSIKVYKLTDAVCFTVEAIITGFGSIMRLCENQYNYTICRCRPKPTKPQKCFTYDSSYKTDK